MYKKGHRFELKLKEMLEREGYIVIRSAGSKGIDLIAGKNGKLLIFECKSTKKDVLYIDKEDVIKLILYSKAFNAIPYLAVKFNREILFFNPYNLEEKGKSYLIPKCNSLRFQEIL
ncbi:Holliday junction resolvase Hjc [Methanocaldococcus sp.]